MTADASNPSRTPTGRRLITTERLLPTIGIITAVEEEYAAVEAMLDNSRPYNMPGRGAGRRYLIGEVPIVNGGRHHVALTLVPEGTNIASARARLLLEHFSNVKYVIMVGIAGGVPNPEKADDHVRKGDVVVSNRMGVIDYGYVKQVPGEANEDLVPRLIPRHSPRPPNPRLLDEVRHLLVRYDIHRERGWLNLISERTSWARRPPEDTDILLDTYDRSKTIPHPEDQKRQPGQPRLHTGPIASSNVFLQDPVKRDQLRDEYGIKAVEMESSGIADSTWEQEAGFLVVRGISDYCDQESKKGDVWKNYAAAVAAAFTRWLLESFSGDIPDPLSMFGEAKERLEIVQKTEDPPIVDRIAFHKIRALRWSYIEAGADSDRDLYRGIWNDLHELEEGFRFVCILGEPLSGKSTLMRRLGYNLASNGKWVLFVRERQNHPDIWARITEFCEHVNELVYVLVDDIFENREAFHVIRGIAAEATEKGLNLRILCTSRLGISAGRGLRDLTRQGVPVSSKELKLTSEDKVRILYNIGIDPMSIPSRPYERLIATNRLHPFLAGARELLERRRLDEVDFIPSELLEEERLKRLQQEQSRIYHALKYICFVHRYEVVLPLSLLDSLGYGNTLLLEGHEDWIIPSESGNPEAPTLESVHWSLSNIYWNVYLQSVNPNEVLKELVRTARANDAREGVFITHLFRVCLDDPHLDLKSILQELSSKIMELWGVLGVDHLRILSRIYRKLQLEEEAAQCLEDAKVKTPVNVADARVLITMLQEENPERVLGIYEEWRAMYPENRTLTMEFIGFLGKKFPDRLRTLRNQVSEWLEEPGQNWNIVDAYVDLVIGRSPELIPDLANRLKEWLNDPQNENHLNAASLWVSYLKLIDAQHDIVHPPGSIGISCPDHGPTAELPLSLATPPGDSSRHPVFAALHNSWKWLLKHRNQRGYTTLAHFYVEIADKYGTDEHKREVLKELLAWLGNHPRAGHIWVACLNLIDGEWAGQADREEVIDKIVVNIEDLDHPNTINKLLSPLGKWGTHKEKRAIINRIHEWLKDPFHEGDNFVRSRYLKFVGDWGTQDQIYDAYDQNKLWIEKHPEYPGVQTVWTAFLTLVETNIRELLGAEVNDAEQYLEAHPDAETLRNKVEKIRRLTPISQQTLE